MSTASTVSTFDLQGPLPAPRSTTVLEASAGTGKTFALAGLVTRYIAEGTTTLDRMLLITFGHAASQELRERVRSQITQAAAAFDDPSLIGDNEVVRLLVDGTEAQRTERRQRLRDAIAGFDAATIATTHQFCNLVLKSLGVAGDSDSGVTLVESLDDLITEIVGDLYLEHFATQKGDPVLTYRDALRLARAVAGNPETELRPRDPEPESAAAVRIRFANDVLAALETRKRQLGVLGYDDLLTRLARALEAPDSPARTRMHERWSVVMVDEFQDTDPVQWRVIDCAFSGHSTIVLIGDPKQAIYAFRGGDIVTYLRAADTAGDKQTLGTNWRSDSALVDRLQTVLEGAQLGDPRIVVHDVEARHQGSRLSGAPCNDPFRLRVVSRETFRRRGIQNVPIADIRQHIGRDLAGDIGALLGSGATFDGRPIQARDIAVIVETHRDARVCQQALNDAGVPCVYTGDSDIFESTAAADWLTLLEAFDQPHRSGLVRAAAATMFLGYTAEKLVEGGEDLTDRIAETLREWAGHARERGVAAIFEAAQLKGMSDRVLSWHDGERQMTDLAHVTQLLQDVAHREGFTLPALRDWLRAEREERGDGRTERSRRLDSDAAAVQIMTVWVSKGLQYPIVYLPFAFNRHVPEPDFILFHDGETRCLHVGGPDSPDFHDASRRGRSEGAGDDSRLTYVALTRAQSQVVAWWAAARDEPYGGLSRLLRGRGPGDAVVPDACTPTKISDADASVRLQAWASRGGPVLEESVPVARPAAAPPAAAEGLDARHFHRTIDAAWRRTSYSGLIRVTETAGVSSEPEITEKDDELDELDAIDPALVTAPAESAPAPSLTPSPMAALPTGATFGTLVHAVLETADPLATELAAELEAHIRDHMVWWPVDVAPAELAAALVPVHDTPLGPLADGLTLRRIGMRDRLRELDFEFPLAGGDLRANAPDLRLRDVGHLLAAHLDPADPMASYAGRLTSGVLGAQSLRGYLSGQIDAVLRVPDTSGGHRYLVVDYKTNWLGESDEPLTAASYDRPRMTAAMLHSDYPLQALLYCVVLHRFLRWRQPGYDPERHLGGVLYLFLRGMCGPDTPVVDGHPAGVFDWRPPAALIADLSDLLDAGA